MDYKVDIAGPALAEAETYVDFIRQQSNDDQAAQDWWNGLRDAILSLESLPGRCPLIPERHRLRRDLHQLLYASHRIIFRIQTDKVTVLRIYHAARTPLKSLRAGSPKESSRPSKAPSASQS